MIKLYTRFIFVVLFGFCCVSLVAGSSTDIAAAREAKLQTLRTIVNPVAWRWRYKVADVPNGQDSTLDDSSWASKEAETIKWGNERVAWFRASFVVPEVVAGIGVKGSRVTFKCGIDDEGIIYVNGKEAQRFRRDQGSVVLDESAVPGEKISIAIKGINTQGPGWLLFSKVEYSKMEDLRVATASFLDAYDFAHRVCKSAGLVKSAPYVPRMNAELDRINLSGIGSASDQTIIAALDAGDRNLRQIASEISSRYDIYLVGHGHIDFAFLWPWTETLDVIKNTFGTVTGLMDKYPFVYSQSQAALYEETKRSYPDIYARIQEKTKSGQWDVSNAGTWSEGDSNMSSGEAIVRSILLAKRFMRQEFGVEPTVGWQPDTFGHAWTLPQILSKSGIKYYYFMRGPGKPLFWWQSPDGSKVLAYQYGGYNLGVDAQEMAANAVDFCTRSGVNDYMRPFGVGDHGGGPTKAHLRTVTELQARSDYPKLKYSSASGYFETVAKSGKRFPTINGELNPVFAGCYTSHADAKRYNRECENRLMSSEVLASLASGFGQEYPTEQFRASWKKTCFNQFHDILCGTAIHAGYEYPRLLRDEVVAQTQSASQAAMKALAAQINTRGRGIPIVVYNPLGWARTDYVSVASPFAGCAGVPVTITDPSGRVTAGRSLGNRLTFTARDVPPMGYKVFWANRATKPIGSNVRVNGSVAENQFFKVSIDPKSGVITAIYDKVNHRNVVPPGQYADLLQILSEQSDKMSAWKIGPFMDQKNLLDQGELVKIDTGPAKVTLQYDHRYDKSIFTQELTLYDAVPRIDIKLAASWNQPWVRGGTTPFLKVAFTSALKDPKATFEIPFGSIERAKNGQECVGQKWADLSDADYGVSILNDCKYGFDVSGNTLRMSLLRSSQRPDPRPDIGTHEMTFSIYPHKGDWRAAGTVRKGYELNEPMMGLVTAAHDGKLPREKSFLSVSAPNLVITAVKNAEDNDGLIVRLYETNGKSCRSTIQTSLPGGSWVETDLMERPIGKAHPIVNGRIGITVGKYEIKTYKILK